ncbi:hypothetical protein RRG08_053137 [Elysia crispata]|uniref:Reverse transcriptase domain-containing protein n=1 Tax=Elysia crispata TaxID=231223 RepID=A0AAE1AIJ1_9GAST|nr:hypothetical protein RRG08_053137 [Elysia crispata]
MGDFNAKIGVKDEDEENEWIGPFGIGTRNERGEKLIDFCTANRLFVTNSFFKKPRPRYWTWESPGGDYKNQIDFILTTDKTTIQNTEIITKVDIGSDHRMVIEKSNEYNLPLCVGFIDYEKAFDSVEHFAIFDALRKININETYVAILENIYQKATARVHIDNLESETFPINRGSRQGDPISPKMFTTAMEMIFRKGRPRARNKQ